MKARVDDRVYEMHDLSADKREGMREYGYAYRRGYALAMVLFSLALCVFAGYLHGHRFPDMPCTYCFLPEYRQPFWYIKNSARSSGSLSVMCFLR